MIFFILAFVFLCVGRKIGWTLSRRYLYTTPSYGGAVIACAMWGLAVAVIIFALIRWQDPNMILKIIMGYALGGYVAIPNFGLIKKETIHNGAKPRHDLISNLPIVAYSISIVVLSWK